MKKFFFLPILALLFLAVSCPRIDQTPKPDALPSASQVGAGTCGFLLNGKVWLPGGKLGGPSLDVQYYRGEFLLSATRKVDNVFQAISWARDSVYKPGIYYFKSALGGGSPGAGLIDFNNKCGNGASTDKDSLQNWVNIAKIDSLNHIVSGTFNLYFTKTGCDTIRITNGRFDAKYTF